MATALPIAKALLKDCKPPISDQAISDSLWHYWFDVEKAVGWLRKDWEKKGELFFILPLPPPPPAALGTSTIQVGKRTAG